MAAAMVGKTNGRKTAEEVEQREGKFQEDNYLSLFAAGAQLKERFGNDFKDLPAGSIGLYSYVDRLRQGLQQLMAGARKFRLDYIDRGDIVSLTREATDVSGIPYVMDCDREEIEAILSGNGKVVGRHVA